MWITEVSSNRTQIKLPLVSGGQYNFNVSWGDGSSDIITTNNQTANPHNYASQNKKINGMGIEEILSVSFVGVLVVAITIKKRKIA